MTRMGKEEEVLTSFMSSPGLLDPVYRQHVMLLYDSDYERKVTTVGYINEGLKSGYLCIYASVGAYDSASKWHYYNLSSKIENFEENVKQNNLVIIDLKPFFEAARKRYHPLFNQLKLRLESMLKQRIAKGKGDKILIFADAACTLSENKEFEECVELESWWHSAHQEWAKSSQNITVICPHPAAVFNEQTTAHAKAEISAVHSIMLQAPHHYCQQHPPTAAVARPIRRLLIAEPEGDIQILYRLYLESRGLEVTIVSTGGKCLDSIFDTVDSKGFDLIILDTHLKDITGIEVARKIKERLPDQRIIITSTTAASAEEEIERVGVPKDYVLQKPFRFSKLLALMTSPVAEALKKEEQHLSHKKEYWENELKSLGIQPEQLEIELNYKEQEELQALAENIKSAYYRAYKTAYDSSNSNNNNSQGIG